MRRLVVVGASLAGLRAAQAARSAGYDGGLVVIGDEPHLPYTRPPLSKEMLHSGHTGEQSAFPIGELDVDWRLGTGAVALDRARRQLTLADGEHVTYERLIIATGCRARQWEGPGSGLPGVMTLRTLDDALALQTRLRDAGHILIVGAGFIGCEVAASARSLGVDVTLIDIAPHPMLPLGPELGERWFQMHSGHGVDLRMSVGVDSLEGNGRVEHARLTDGTRIDTDLVLIALGSRLNSEWLSGSGLEMNPGIVTDATLTSVSDPNVLAAGDIAASPVALADGAPTRIEHWTTAAEHG
ncbi:MAG: NAD(P)/FAD-dependent oxidoreductase, partial [Conexibacteraceae bacterium]|nr:NAD(P)/FAD-dependent oxidoreductase [Conexibacteraceae bacterium]